MTLRLEAIRTATVAWCPHCRADGRLHFGDGTEWWCATCTHPTNCPVCGDRLHPTDRYADTAACSKTCAASPDIP